MKKPGLATAVSILINFLLAGWLVNNYLHDPYFASYVNLAISPLIPYLVLTIGIGGGSSLGYLLLRKKHSGGSLSERLQKIRPAKPVQLPGPTGSALQSKSTPVGAPPGPTSKHTAYAVPPLPKSSTPSSQKTSPPPLAPSWSMSKQSIPPALPVQRPEQRTGPPMSLKQTTPTFPSTGSEPSAKQFPRFQESPELSPRQSQSPTPTFQSFRSEGTSASVQNSLGNTGQEISRPGQTPRPTIDTGGKPAMGSQWRPDSPTGIERKNEVPNFYSRPFSEDSRPTNPNQSPGLRQPGPQGSTTGFQTPKTQPSDPGSRSSQWTDPVPKQGYTPPQKWAPPSVSPVPTNRAPPAMGQNTRPGQAPPRPPFPPGQGAQRPLTYPGLSRTLPGMGNPPGAFRPEQARSQGTPSQQPPTSATQRPSPPQWTQQAGERKDTPPSSQIPASNMGRSTPQPQTPTMPDQSQGGPSGGEMDWDTALDTILKTLRKDKVDDKP